MENMKRTILIIGNAGYIGGFLYKYYLSHPHFQVFGIDIRNIKNGNQVMGDITDVDLMQREIENIKPQVLINCAAISNLDFCEKQKDIAMSINYGGNKNIIDAIKNNKEVKYIFLSSDYVFDGIKGNFSEDDLPTPKTYYGFTKLKSEDYIKQNLNNYAICRSANVYGFGGKFFTFVSNNLHKNKAIEVFKDTYYNPTYIGSLINMIDYIITNDLRGIFHTVGSSVESRYSFALKVAEIFKADRNLIIPIKKPDNFLIAHNSSLNINKTRSKLKDVDFLGTDVGLNEVAKNNEIRFRFKYRDMRGYIKNIFQGNNWKEVNYIQSKKNCVRGMHYHKKITEGFYIVNGKVEVTINNIISKENRVFLAATGDSFLIRPNEVHTFNILEDSSWINFLSNQMVDEPKDLHKVSKGNE